jgi:AmmeMemoRadiSam system protein A
MPFPADTWAGERLREMDEATMEAIGSLRPRLLQEALTASGSTVCGVEPISLLLQTLQLLDTPEDEVFQQTLDYQTSGELTGDFQHSVSYGALGYFSHRSMELGAEDRQLLLDSVRRTLCSYLETGQRRSIPPERITPALEWRSTAFVTLHENGKLRGCVGRRSARDPLYRIVPELALSAALDDSRFEPVAPGESGLEAEISVLTPMKRLQDVSEFRVNRHGALLDAGHHQALLLPQVATERGWNAEQFLDALARKAGAGRSVYSGRNTRLFAFRAQIIQ